MFFCLEIINLVLGVLEINLILLWIKYVDYIKLLIGYMCMFNNK